jgi:hypothetical protein
MPKPQQEELRRSGRGSTDQDSASARARDDLPADENPGPVPEENRPGHHPARDQDKPESAPQG